MDFANISGLDAIALAAASGDQTLAEFFADAKDVDVEEIGKSIVGFVKEVFVKFGAGDEFAAMEGEVFENGIFARGEHDRFAGAGDRFGSGIDFDIAEFYGGIGFAASSSERSKGLTR
jgi:hypothetical protein